MRNEFRKYKDNKKAFKSIRFEGFFVVPLGFEPRPREPKSPVLPLHHGTKHIVIAFKAMQI
jgi:hypothetical protein